MPLAQAAADRGLEMHGLEAELAAVVTLGLPAERRERTEDLISLIETRYHATHRRELPELVRLARRDLREVLLPVSDTVEQVTDHLVLARLSVEATNQESMTFCGVFTPQPPGRREYPTKGHALGDRALTNYERQAADSFFHSGVAPSKEMASSTSSVRPCR